MVSEGSGFSGKTVSKALVSHLCLSVETKILLSLAVKPRTTATKAALDF